MSKNNVWIDESPLASVVNISSGNPTQGSISPNPPAVGVPYDPLVHGGSTLFDGVDDVLNVAYDSNIDFGTGDFTIEFWINPKLTDRFICGGSSVGANTLSIQTTHSSFYYILVGVNGTTIGTVTGVNCGQALPNQWTHIAVSRNSGTWRAYRNGVLSSTYTNSVAVNIGTGGLFIGKGHSTDTTRFIGNLGPIRFVKGIGLYPSGASFTPEYVFQAVSGTVFLLNHYNIGIFDSACKANIVLDANASRNTSIFKYGDGSLQANSSGPYGENPSAYGNLKNAIGTSDFTIEAWVNNPTTLSTSSHIISFGERGVTGNVRMSLVNYGRVGLYLNGSLLISSSTIVSSGWNHIAVTRQGNIFRVFLNGFLEATTTFSGFNCTNTLFEIGGGDNYTSLETQIDDIRVTIGIARYITNFTPPSALPKA